MAKKHQPNILKVDVSAQEVEEFVRDAMNSAGERDIYTGDHVEIKTVTTAGVTHNKFDLKFD